MNLLSSRDEDGERPADDEFKEAKEGGTIDIDQEIDDAFHCGQGEDESSPSTIESSIDGVRELLIGCEGHVPGETGGGRSSSFCGLATGKKVLLGARDGTLGRVNRSLKPEDDEEE